MKNHYYLPLEVKNSKTILSTCSSFMMLFALFFFNAPVSMSQCTNTSSYGSATAPTAGNSANFSTCSYRTEYSTLSGAVSGQTYQMSVSSASYVTIRKGSYNGSVAAHGSSPLTWNCTSSGTYYVHWNTNSSCGQTTGCVTTTVANTTSSGGGGSGPATYCTNNATSSCNYLGIDYVGVGSISSGTNPGSSTEYNFCYSDKTSLSTIMSPGLAYTIQVSPGGSSSYNQMMYVFLDWNCDGDFSDAGECYQVNGGSYVLSNTQTIYNVDVVVPAGATIGTSRMRVQGSYYNSAGNCNPCGNYNYGETEDYTILIEAPVACTGTPAGGTATISGANDCAGTSHSMAVTGQDSGNGYNSSWYSSSSQSGPWTSINSSASPYSSTATTTTYYKFGVTCASNGLTGYSNVVKKGVATISAVSGGGTSCTSGSQTLTATTQGYSTYWYTSATSGNNFYTGNSYTTPTLTSTTTYYAASSGCTSVRNAGTVTIADAPVVDAGTFSAVCDQANGQLNGTATVNNPGLLKITELDPGSPDFVEIQNVGGAPVDVTGYRLVTNSTYNSWACNQTAPTLSGTMTPGEVKYYTDASNDNYWGNNLMYNPGSPSSYTNFLMLLDNNGNVVDFYCSGFSASVTAAGTISWAGSSYPVSAMWSGAGHQGAPSSAQSFQRTGSTDGDALSNWSVATKSKGTQNSGLTVPWGPGTPVVTWTPSTGLSATNVLDPTCTVGTTTTYTLSATAGGCTSTDQVTVTVNSANAGITNNETGNATIVTCANTGISVTASGGGTYSWNNGGGTSATQNITSPGTHIVTVTAGGCTDTESITITQDISTATTNAGSNFTKTCTSNANGSTIGASAVSGVTYSWSPSTGLSTATAANPTANPSSTTTYTVTTTKSSNGCTATDDVVVTVDTQVPSANAGSAFTKTCVSNTSGAGIGASGSSANTYSWNNSGSLSSGTAANPSANPSATTTYTLTVTDATSGCTATDDVVVTVDTQVPSANAGSAFTKTCVTNASGAGIGASGSSANTYAWNNSGSLSSGTAANPTANPTATTTYTLTVTDATSGCTATDDV
ncbi:MAG: GEVED domain-containing protein, partial [Crocinitomicaceae bacterium]|nr:GEVED domain-containing protein [Crocinitomicaceae bacterium]